MMFFSISLLLVLLSLATVLSSPATLLPLERQRKSLQEDIAFFLPEDSGHTPFRERQDGLKSVATQRKRSTLPSVFSERQHLIEAKNAAEEFRRKRVSSAAPHSPHRSDQERWDPWFPALPQDRKRFKMDSEREAINSALKHMAWERLNKRLVQLHGQQGPYLDRGERRVRRIKKRAPARTSSETKKELEAILADDVGEQPKHDPKAKPENNASKSVSNGKAEVAPRQNVQKGPKGKQWMPLDSEPTLRSKKSWDEYFGIDKRDSRALPEAENSVENDELSEDEGTDQELKDYLVQWYFNKMLKHLTPMSAEGMANGEDLKKKKRKNARLTEDDIIIKNADDGRNIDLSDGIPFEEVDERLRNIEDWLLSDATQIIENGMNGKEKEPKGAGTARGEELENDLMDHLKAAYSLEKMRDALAEFQDAFNKIRRQEGALERAANKEFGDDTDKKKKKKRKNVGETPDQEDDFDKKKKKSVSKKNIADGRSSNQIPNAKSWTKNTGLSKNDLTNEVASPVFAPEPQGDHNLPCPVMTASLGYCEELSDALGEMGQMLARPCVEHMICYTCDDTPSVCNVAFLQDASELCEDDFRCQAIAGAMRSVFLADHDRFRFKHEALCDVDQCLLQLQQWN